MNEETYARLFEEAYWHSEHHMPDLNVVGKYALSELVREKGFKVVLTGEGSDEHFGGYLTFLPDFLREADDTWPASKWDDATRIAALESNANTLSMFRGSQKKVEQASTLVIRMLNNTSIVALSFLVKGDFAAWTKSLAPTSSQETIANSIDGRILELINTRWHQLHTAEYVWTKGFLSIILSGLGDRTEMAHSIEGRPPFLDHVLRIR
jgi:asparagine synthase (glutamine-hydrolysing)